MRWITVIANYRGKQIIFFFLRVQKIFEIFSKTIILFYQSPLILTELFQHNLINVSYLTAC